MGLYGYDVRSRFQNTGIDTSPSQGADITVTQPKPDRTMEMAITGEGHFNGYGKGDLKTGLAVGAFGGESAGTAASLGQSAGAKANSPWEAFIVGGKRANEQTLMNPGPQTVLNAEPGMNFVAGGLGGLGGYMF